MLMTSKAAGIIEIATVLSVPVVLIGASRLLLGEDHGLQQIVILLAIVIMVALVYVGLRLRGQRWDHLG